jgi:hypothetical protein
MKITLDGAGKTLRLDFESADALRSFAGDWLTKEGCLVRLAEPLKLWTELTVELRQAGAVGVTVEARVVQVFGGGAGGFATALQASETRPLAAFAPEPHDREGSPSNEPPDDPSDSVGGEMQGTSPVFRIRQMNVSQKMQLASKATVGERQILLRDASPQVLMGLLANPRIEDKEVLALAKSSSASSGVLQRIAKDRRWSTNYEIRVALVENPQTPTPLAVRMLDTLRERELRVMAKGSAVREVIRAAALRKVIKLG